MIEAAQQWWNDHVPRWVRVRCTDRFVGHALFFLFVLGSYWLVSVFHVPLAEVLASGFLGGAFFLVTRFVLHEKGWAVTGVTAVVGVVAAHIVLPYVVGGEGWTLVGVVERLPVLLAMVAVEVVEDDSLEEEVEGYEARRGDR